MSLLSRSKSSGARPARPARKPRVFLTREENKAVNALQPKERWAGYLLAGYVAICVTIIQAYVHGFNASHLWKLGVSLGLAAALVAASRFGNRLAAGLAAIACVYGPSWNIYTLAATPLFGLMLYLTFRISSARRKMIDEHIARGDLGVDPRSVARQGRNRKANETATSDSTGRTLAAKSKRYTPPKASKK